MFFTAIMNKQIKSRIEDLVFYHTAFKNRYKDGANDLQKGHSKGLAINEDQKETILAFWSRYLINRETRHSFDIRWFDIYNKANLFGFELKYYIPDSFLYCVVDPFFSDYRSAQAVDDKNLYDLLFYDVKQPRTVCRKIHDSFLDPSYRIISEERAIDLCRDCGKVIIKPAIDTCAGAGLIKWDRQSDEEDSLKQAFHSDRSLVIQEYIEQHPDLSAFNPSCVNTLRLITLFFEGRVYLLSSAVIMGGENAVTNHLHRGGLICGILENGRLRPVAFDGRLNQYERHPNGIIFSECCIPGYSECVDIVKRIAPRMSQTSKLISWDFTIDRSGNPVLIETNLSWGGSIQLATGPLLGDLTPEVFDYMLKKGMRRLSSKNR